MNFPLGSHLHLQSRHQRVWTARYVTERGDPRSLTNTKRELALDRVTDGGARRVVISAPSSEFPTSVYGVNPDKYEADEERRVISCASWTTNDVTPVLEVLQREFGITEGFSQRACSPAIAADAGRVQQEAPTVMLVDRLVWLCVEVN
ncbi:uncharacterized protein BJX67DRAFT_353081 [Aspergillus lucknowensis]|uniref:Uncharacterized protein n=1 Tax=Aspergillus lucknowensis TaxID=176173 RepID=A0ABR4LSA6_9EURO